MSWKLIGSGVAARAPGFREHVRACPGTPWEEERVLPYGRWPSLCAPSPSLFGTITHSVITTSAIIAFIDTGSWSSALIPTITRMAAIG